MLVLYVCLPLSATKRARLRCVFCCWIGRLFDGVKVHDAVRKEDSLILFGAAYRLDAAVFLRSVSAVVVHVRHASEAPHRWRYHVEPIRPALEHDARRMAGKASRLDFADKLQWTAAVLAPWSESDQNSDSWVYMFGGWGEYRADAATSNATQQPLHELKRRLARSGKHRRRTGHFVLCLFC